VRQAQNEFGFHKIDTIEILGRARNFLDYFLAYHGKCVRFAIPNEVVIATPEESGSRLRRINSLMQLRFLSLFIAMSSR
jgi:hypothetical protein